MLTFRESGHGVFRDALYYFSNTFVNQNIKKKKKKLESYEESRIRSYNIWEQRGILWIQ